MKDCPEQVAVEHDAGELAAWFLTEPGRAVASLERAIAGELLADLFGYHIVQVGDPFERPLIEDSRIGHRVVLGEQRGQHGLRARPEALPLAAACIDVLVLPHLLEFSTSPHEVLREAERVLIAEGHLLVFGFSPVSLFGLWRLLAAWRGEMPWRGQFLRRARLADWLTLLGFEIERAGACSFRPPLANPRLFARLAWMERLGGHFWPVAGNCYWLLARKRVAGIRPIRALQRRHQRLRMPGVAEPGMGKTSSRTLP